MATCLTPSETVEAIRSEAIRIGFSACGFASVADVPAEVWNGWQKWIAAGKHDAMSYMERYGDLRRNPIGLLDGAQTIICVALNYYPAQEPPPTYPRFAYYAYGKDYHVVLREMIQQLAQFVQTLVGGDFRICCDTAPIFERYWATRAGIGFIGRNSQLILPEKGSYFYLGELLTTASLPPSAMIGLDCGKCRRCIDACPTQAIGENRTIDARRCISCQTIENKATIPPDVATRLGHRVYGCDTCQQVCPYNRYATPTAIADLHPNEEFLALSYKKLKNLSQEDYCRIFRHSAVKRAKYKGLMRNIAALDPRLFDTNSTESPSK